MRKRTIGFAFSAGLALGTACAASAQNFDSDWRGASLLEWDDPSAMRPNSWFPGTSYGYVAAGAGPSDFDLSRCSAGFSCDESDLGYKLSTGGKFSRWLGVEAAYAYLGKSEADGGSEKAQGVNLNLVATLPLGERFNVYGKVGGIYGWTRTRAPVGGAMQQNDEKGLNWSYGAGIQLDVNRSWAVKADWDHYRFDYPDRTDDAQLYSLSLVYKF